MNNKNQYYVQAVLKREIIVYCTLKNKVRFLKQLGAKREWFWKKTWSIKFESKEQMANIFMQLNTSGSAFSFDQHGWGPSSIFLELKENGLVNGTIYEIAWTGGGKYIITER